MASTNSKQMTTGKSFEYALLVSLEEKLKDKTNLEVIKNSAFNVAKSCFDSISSSERSECLLSASFAVNFLMDIEPRLSNDIGKDDILQLEILSDHHGKSGDVRDVLAIRLLQKWEIGISAKNNHKAVKHSRLSSNIDFGDYLNIKIIKDYTCAVITFQSIDYPSVNITLPVFGNVNISVESLNDKLLNTDGRYRSEQAAGIDEDIFFFVDDRYIYKSNMFLKQHILSEVV